jgi:putative flippase GtrA
MQAVVVRLYHGAYAIPLSIACGTIVGLVLKYVLDKKWIFRWKAQGARHDASTFVLYAFTGVFTTAIFWGSEYLFELRFHSENMRYVGAIIGLAIGYIVKYQMDRIFVFSSKRSNPGRAMFWVTVAILAFGIGKMLLIVGSPQLIALPNNWDFIRVESCMGLWQDYSDGTPKTESHLSAPVNSLVLDRDVRMDACVITLDDLYPYLATRFRNTGAHINFHVIGGLRIAAVLGALAALLWLARNALSRLIVSVIFLAVFGDLIYLLYFNTLYNEVSVFLGAFVGTSCLWLLWTANERSTRATVFMLILGIATLGLAKQQYSGLATLFAVAAMPVLIVRKKQWKLSAVLLAVGLACPIGLSMLNPADYGLSRSIKLANITDTYLGEVLPHAQNRDQALRLLHMPPECAKGIGETWYTPGLQAAHPCPSLIRAHRARLIPLFFAQPSTFIEPMSDALDRTRPMPEVAYHLFEQPDMVDGVRYRLVKSTSFTTYANDVPRTLFRGLLIVSMFVGALCALLSLVTVRRAKSGGIVLLAMGGTIVLYAIASSVFGDGLTDMTRHAVMWPFGLSLQFIGLAILVNAAIRNGIAVRSTPDQHVTKSDCV